MLLTSKLIRLKVNGKREYTEEKEFLVNFAPNHYDLPVSKEQFEKAEVGKDYELQLGDVLVKL